MVRLVNVCYRGDSGPAGDASPGPRMTHSGSRISQSGVYAQSISMKPASFKALADAQTDSPTVSDMPPGFDHRHSRLLPRPRAAKRTD